VLAGGLTRELTLAALESGDRVEVQVEDIGVLTNEVVAEPAR
jgi:2-keto-4-pentenoate hydratase/2-oxohepta-3-ene-1,7-dioic acid hydratase in catechol pathway